MKVKVFLVGGTVRDLLMGKSPKDVDVVVQGLTLDAAKKLWGNPVGDFPVWRIQDFDVALTRVERKTGKGYNGFVIDHAGITDISQDLARRDFTINSLALLIHTFDKIPSLQDIVDVVSIPDSVDVQNLFAPKGWDVGTILSHLTQKLLVPVSDQAFIEDPLRAIRLARFASRGFNPSTQGLQLAEQISSDDYLALPKDRLIKEANKAADGKTFFKVLDQMNLLYLYGIFKGALDDIFSMPCSGPNVTTLLLAYGSTFDWLKDVDRNLAKFNKALTSLTSTTLIDKRLFFDYIYSHRTLIDMYYSQFFCLVSTLGGNPSWINLALQTFSSITGNDVMNTDCKNVSGKDFGDCLKQVRFKAFLKAAQS